MTPEALDEIAPLARDCAGEKVSALQRSLAAFGYKIIETGVYDEDTEIAVAAFQRHYRPARVDGRADASTRDALARLLAMGASA